LAPMERQEQRRGAAGAAYQRKAAMGSRTKSKEGVFFYSRALCGGNAGLRKERGRDVTARLGGRASVRSRGTERSEGSNGRGWRGGNVEGIFVCMSVARR
jgi:hypothetical protein